MANDPYRPEQARRETDLARRAAMFQPSSRSLDRTGSSARRMSREITGALALGLVIAVFFVIAAVDGNLQGEYRNEATGALHWGAIVELFLLTWIPVSVAALIAVAVLGVLGRGARALRGRAADAPADSTRDRRRQP